MLASLMPSAPHADLGSTFEGVIHENGLSDTGLPRGSATCKVISGTKVCDFHKECLSATMPFPKRRWLGLDTETFRCAITVANGIPFAYE